MSAKLNIKEKIAVEISNFVFGSNGNGKIPNPERGTCDAPDVIRNIII